jgi:hypothetical protein
MPREHSGDAIILLDFDDLPARAISYRFQFSALIFRVLLRRADTNVECNALHRAGGEKGSAARLRTQSSMALKSAAQADVRHASRGFMPMRERKPYRC